MAETCKRHPSLTTRDWPGLPNDLLESIFERLENDLKDGLSFSAVCKQWRLLVAEKGRHVIPGIMLVAHDENDLRCNIGNIFSLASSDNSYKTYLPKVQGRRCYGSVNGLLITIDMKFGRTYLFNPVSGKHVLVQCPSILAAKKKEQDIINRVDLFGNVDEDYLVVVYRQTSKLIHFCKRGRKKWNTVSITFGGVQNIGYHGGKLYVTSVSGTIEVFNTQRSSEPSKSCIIKVRKPRTEALLARFDEVKYLDVPYKNEDGWISHRVCLVETPERELLMTIELVELYENSPLKTRGFIVFKLDKSGGGWTQLESLGEWVLFVGMKSICVMVHDVPRCQANSIYFTNPRHWNNTGVFNMEDKSVKPLYESCPFKLSPMTWFIPSLRQLG
ncbi:hypothetical protein ACHQM5_024926 [Ranunculus cassubicifolius]